MGKSRKIYLKKAGNHPQWDIFAKDEENSSLASDHIRIKVEYSGLNFADVLMKLGLYPDAPSLPYIPGYELSGTIAAVGSAVEGFSIGQKVCAGTAFGGYQSSIDLPCGQVIALPKHLSLEQGASLIVSFLTAYTIFVQLARVRSKDRVLIDCGTGALGRTSIQLLHHLGVNNITALTRSPDKIKLLEDQGVQGKLHKDMLPKIYERSFDVILNSRGGLSLREDYRRLALCGRLVAIGASSFVNSGKKNMFTILRQLWGMRGFSPVTLMNDNRAIMGLNVLRLFEPDSSGEMSKINEALDYLATNPIVEPRVDRVFAADEVDEGLTYLANGKSCGKVLLKW